MPSLTVTPTAVTTTGSSPFWESSTNIIANDGVLAEAVITRTTLPTETIEGKGFDTSAIQGRAVHRGITATVERQAVGVGDVFVDHTIRLLIDGVQVGDNQANTTPWGALSEVTYGTSLDMWGLTEVQAEQVNGIAIAAYQQTTSVVIADIDYVSVTFHYDLEPPLRYTRLPHLTLPGGQQANLR